MTSSKKKLKKYLKKVGTMASWGAIALFPVGVAQILKGDSLPGILALMVAALASPLTLVPFKSDRLGERKASRMGVGRWSDLCGSRTVH